MPANFKSSMSYFNKGAGIVRHGAKLASILPIYWNLIVSAFCWPVNPVSCNWSRLYRSIIFFSYSVGFFNFFTANMYEAGIACGSYICCTHIEQYGLKAFSRGLPSAILIWFSRKLIETNLYCFLGSRSVQPFVSLKFIISMYFARCSYFDIDIFLDRSSSLLIVTP